MYPRHDYVPLLYSQPLQASHTLQLHPASSVCQSSIVMQSSIEIYHYCSPSRVRLAMHMHTRAHNHKQHVYRHLIRLNTLINGQNWACPGEVNGRVHTCITCRVCQAMFTVGEGFEVWCYDVPFINVTAGSYMYIAFARWRTGHQRDSWYSS